MTFTSDLWAACKANRHRGSRSIGGGVLSLSNTIGLVDRLASAELSVICWRRTEPRRLVVTRLNDNFDTFNRPFLILHTAFRKHLITTHAPHVTHRNHCGWEQLFATFSEQSAGTAVAHWAAWGSKWHGSRLQRSKTAGGRWARKVPWMLSRCWPACMGRLEA